MITLRRRGPHTHLEAEMCRRCPQGSTGCCAAPPVVAWADLGRIVTLGGRDWLLAELAAGNLYPCPRGLALRRVDNPDAADTGRAKKCVYHGPEGCVVPADRRSATCNYYVCDEAWAEAERSRDVRAARAMQERLTNSYAEWDLVLGARVRARAARGDGVRDPSGAGFVIDAPLLDSLGEQFRALARS
jgi:hypothetical protein